MNIYLARHGEYAPSLEGELSPQGRKNLSKIINFIKPLHLQVKYIYHSGILRAEQTAEMYANGFISAHPIAFKKGLNPIDDVSFLINEIEMETENILLVGHLPFLNKLLSKLVVANEHKELLTVHPGTLICLNKIASQRWLIAWVINPQLFCVK